ncbi:MAG: hypothetical protein V3U21_01105 [Thermodesulfobacteriota bacterium]
MKVAIFKSIEYGHESANDDGLEDVEGYLRITEYIDVEFVPIDRSEIVTKEISILKEVKKKIQAETELKLVEVDRKIGDLLALPEDIKGE